jgi:hypothetical protein
MGEADGQPICVLPASEGLPGMRDLPIACRVYILLLSLVALSVTLLALWICFHSPLYFVPILLFAGLICLADLSPTVIPGELMEVSVSGAINIAVVFLYPWHVAFLSVLLGTLLAEIRSGRAWYKQLFNMDLALSYAALGFSFHLLFGGFETMQSLPEAIWRLSYIALGDTVLNQALVTLVVALSEGLSPVYVWRTTVSSMMGQMVAMPVLGLVFAILWDFKEWSVAFMILPLWVLGRSFGLYAELRQSTEKALQAFADAIDARDPLTYNHSQRVAESAVKLAEGMGLPQDEIDVIHLAARLHDLGKVGITDQWLRKAGPLTPEERLQFREHAALGARLVSQFSLFNVGVGLIRSTHERYDGTGYPDGIRGEDIPLGARIIAVADAFDAMTSRRPYRGPMPKEVAIRNLQEGVATQFDPKVVAIAVRVLADGAATDAEQETPDSRDGTE